MPEDAAGNRPPGGYELWRFAEEEQELAELHRLLYVATTRAADYLVLSSGVRSVGEAKGPWMQLLGERFDLATGKLRMPLPGGGPGPQVCVTTDEPVVVSRGAPRREKVAPDEIVAALEQAGESNESGYPAIEPVPVDLAARRQYSFSRLAGSLVRQHPPIDVVGEDSPEVDPRGLGTLVHAVLAALDFAEPADAAELVRLHAERHLPADSRQVAEAQAMIDKLLTSPATRRMAAAKQSFVEAEFLLAWPPETNSAQCTLGGYIDRLYQDEHGAWHVVDFKTNRVPAAGVAAIAANYELQMLVYALAAETILGSPPASVTLHFLRTGEEHRFAWDALVRVRTIALVDQAIAAANRPSDPAPHGKSTSASGGRPL